MSIGNMLRVVMTNFAAVPHVLCLCDWSVDAVGQSGVQLFVDAGQPVDTALVTALVREVLAEKISAMFAERLELEHPTRQHATARPTDQPETVTAVLPKHTVCCIVVV